MLLRRVAAQRAWGVEAPPIEGESVRSAENTGAPENSKISRFDPNQRQAFPIRLISNLVNGRGSPEILEIR